jgi:outer membrane protein assembly factor BamB
MMSSSRGPARYAIVALGVLVPCAAVIKAQQWPAFRGTNLSGVAAATARPPQTFDVPKGINIGWRTAIPGFGHSSPIVWNDRVYVTTAVPSTGADAKLALGDSMSAGIDSARDLVPHSWRLLAIDVASGAIVWDREAANGIPRIKRHIKGSHASATPATNGRVIVALFGSEGLFAFDMGGQIKWRQDLGLMDVGLVDDPTYQWGPASSPVIFENLVIVQNDRHTDSFVAAYDLESGKQVWRTPHDELPSWATPLLFQSGGRTELVTNSGKFIRGHDPRSGRELWRLTDSATQVKVPSPISAGDAIIVTGGYPSAGRPIYAIRPGLNGDVAERAALAWKAERGSAYTPTPVVYEGLVYVCTDNGILSAYDAKSGERVYQQRIAAGTGGFSASPVIAAGRLYLASEDGTVFVVRAGRTFELLASNAVGDVIMATPAVSGRHLLVRTQHHLIAASARPDLPSESGLATALRVR